MSDETSYGIIPVRKEGDDWEVLLVSPHHGYWGLPKGHAENAETDLEAATRELFEETGLRIVGLLTHDIFKETYTYRKGSALIHKQVIYFLAKVEGEVLLQPEEIQAHKWVKLLKGAEYVTYPATKRVLIQAAQLATL